MDKLYAFYTKWARIIFPEAIKSRVPEDKLMHFLVGVSIALPFAVLGAGLFGFLLAVLAGIVKEGYDYLLNYRAKKTGEAPPHEVAYMDVVATAIGGWVVWAITALF